MSDPSQANFAVTLSPEVPCPGQQVVIEGHRFVGITHVAAWLGSTTAYVGSPAPSMFDPPGAVRVGDADVDAAGSFRITFTLAARMGPVSTGGELVLQPGENLGLSFIGNGRPTPGGIGFQVGSLTCPGYSPAPFEAHLEPAAPCAGATAHVLGTGFTGPLAKLEFARLDTRFGDGPRLTREAPIGPDGKLDFGFDPAELALDNGQPFFRQGSTYRVTVYDPATSRAAVLSIPYCNTALTDALAAMPGLTPVDALQGAIYRGEAPPKDAYEALAIASQAELEAWGTRHQLPATVMAKLPAVDFAANQLLMVSEGPDQRGPFALEIVAVEPGYRVHPVRWALPVPLPTDFSFDYFVLPRGTVTFAPPAEGAWQDRPTTLRHQARLDLYPQDQPRITP